MQIECILPNLQDMNRDVVKHVAVNQISCVWYIFDRICTRSGKDGYEKYKKALSHLKIHFQPGWSLPCMSKASRVTKMIFFLRN